MPLLNPRNNAEAFEGALRSEDAPEIELLKRSGIIKDGRGLEGHVVNTMEEVGLSLRDILTRVAMILDSGESDGVKLSAAKLALSLHMHPALVPTRNKEEKQQPVINFNIVNTPAASTSINLASVLAPHSIGNQKPESWE